VSLPSHPAWWALVAACLIWYSTITLKIAVHGVADVRRMLANLRAGAGSTKPREDPRAVDRPPEGK
jgi:O-antigen ligase